MRRPAGARDASVRRSMRVVLLALAVMLGVSGASAAPSAPALRSRVVLVARPDDADAVTAEALARVSGELAAAGFDVRAVPVASNADPRATVETVGRALAPAAAFAIFPGAPASDGTPSAEIWVSDRLTGRATVERLSVDPRDTDRRAAVLAVRAVELLKASVAELWVPDAAPPRERATPAPGPPAAPTEAVVVARAAPATAPRTERAFTMEAAAAVIGHVDGFPTDVCPALRLSLALGSDLAARVSAFGLDHGWELSSADGTASVRQQMALAELVLTFRAEHRLQPRLAAGVGASRLDVTGSGNAPWTGRELQVWSAVTGAGGGATLALGKHLALVAEVSALFFWQRPAVRVGDTIAGQAGFPAVVGTAGLLVSL